MDSHRLQRYLASLALMVLILTSPRTGQAASPRRVVVLEYRAGVKGAFGLAARMAEELARLTPHRVLAPADTQRRLGSKVDALVARCQGDPHCVARIGVRIGCDEVILVGISQLGDIILAIQRIQVPSGRVLSRLAASLSRHRRVSRSAIDRYLRRLLPPDEFKRYGRIIIHTSGVGDRVFVDQKLRGKTPLAPIVVPAPGRYSVRVRRPGYVDFVARLDVLPEASVEVKPTLSPLNKMRRSPWYERWWIWALIGGAVVGGTTAAVLGSTRSPTEVPALLRWPQR